MVHTTYSCIRAGTQTARFALIQCSVWFTTIIILTIMLMTSASSCGRSERMPLVSSIGPHPSLPSPKHSLIPTIDVVTAKGWPDGGHPTTADGTTVSAFARGLDHPRWLYVLSNGDVLVAETNAPTRPDDAKGIKGWFFKHYQTKAGGAVPSANCITLLRDTDADGIADFRSGFLSGLNSPFGMLQLGEYLYVADTDALLRFPYSQGQTTIKTPGVKLLDLPAGSINHHWTKNVVARVNSKKLYISVGSNSNVAENGIEQEIDRTAIWEFDIENGRHRIFASGLRNPVGMAFEEETDALWVAVNERDELGEDLVPDYMTAVREGAFYGWPYSYFGQIVDTRVKPQRPDLVVTAVAPDYALGAHTASLGLASAVGASLPSRFTHGMFVGQHGSWNRKPRSGYKVIFVPFAHGRPSGMPMDVLTDFVRPNGDAMGRPVGVAIDKRGGLIVADDVGNTIWRVASDQILKR